MKEQSPDSNRDIDEEEHRVLVTGGAGFIGSHVADVLVESGCDVHVVDSCFTGTRDLVPNEATFYEGDIRTEEFRRLVRAISPRRIVHLAALHYIPYCNEHPEEAFDVNVMGSRNLYRAASDVDELESVVFASSAAVYPPGDAPNREEDETAPIDIYGQTKLVGEDLLELFASETDVSCAAARLFNVFGDAETNPHLIPAILDQLRDGDRTLALGNLTPRRDFVHVSDVADALVTLSADFDESYRTFNVGTGNEHSVREVVGYVGGLVGEEIEITQTEQRIRKTDRQHLCANISRIHAEIGWEPKLSFVEGLGDLIEREPLTVEPSDAEQ
ncbi:NAD-dependent epimerase/dehydratase family protein [Haladaptatus caseinilyticus]|uniref:NAD-dependent epimerase/dehydratase family protein n=1 Tax=Haladaptatus caseinilyticus TaxID=2993314 RepID=UPI00224ADB05|nr:NAD-dependent epimerase/dehydratase family protein [Haladaptatus caseinilyticus]